MGSKFFEVCPVAKGIGSGPSPPTMSLQKAPVATLDRAKLALGAKAEADPARAATEIKATVFMVIDRLLPQRIRRESDDDATQATQTARRHTRKAEACEKRRVLTRNLDSHFVLLRNSIPAYVYKVVPA
eukprot:scaffold34610_cov50-Attheya_sp.AAC.1